MIALKSEEMRFVEEKTMEQLGIPGIILMEHAALAVSNEVLKKTEDNTKVYVFCGTGNNGGDGFAIARQLIQQNITTKIFIIGDSTSIKGDAKTNYNILVNSGAEVICIKEEKDILLLFNKIDRDSIIVDSILGIGCNKPLKGLIKLVAEKINASGAYVVSTDIPTGINCDTGQIMEASVKADKTVCFGFPKIGLFLYPAKEYVGELIIADISIPQSVWRNINFKHEIIDKSYIELLPDRDKIGHKGSFGKVLIFAGSKTMAGAAALSALAAYKAGCGVVKIITERGNEGSIFSLVPEAIILTYEKNESLEPTLYENEILWADAVLAGPGMGNDAYTKTIIEYLLSFNNKNIVIDADGLNCIANNLELLKASKSNIIITPHIGEMSKLTNKSVEDISENKLAIAKQFSMDYYVTCVLKSETTVVASEENIFINSLGNNGMATAGSGDVLAGIICSLFSYTNKALKASVLGVFIHSFAGDYIRSIIGEEAITARNIIEGISALHKRK